MHCVDVRAVWQCVYTRCDFGGSRIADRRVFANRCEQGFVRDEDDRARAKESHFAVSTGRVAHELTDFGRNLVCTVGLEECGYFGRWVAAVGAAQQRPRSQPEHRRLVIPRRFRALAECMKQIERGDHRRHDLEVWRDRQALERDFGQVCGCESSVAAGRHRRVG